MLNALDEAQNAGSTESIDKVEDITSDNVKPEDKDDLEQAKEDLENALTDHGNNYTDEEKAQLEENLDRIESALESLEKVEKVKEAIDALPDSLEPDDLDTVQKTEAAKELYDQLTDHEKELLGSAAADKLNRRLPDSGRRQQHLDAGQHRRFDHHGQRLAQAADRDAAGRQNPCGGQLHRALGQHHRHPDAGLSEQPCAGHAHPDLCVRQRPNHGHLHGDCGPGPRHRHKH